MGVLRAMLDLFRVSRRPPPLCDACPYRPADPGRQRQEEEAERAVGAASQTNSRALMGLIATSGRGMQAESSVRAMMRGVLNEVDRDHDGTH